MGKNRNKNYVARRGRLLSAMFSLLAAACLVMLAGECRAFPYRPETALRIVSEYAPFRSSTPPQTLVWKVTPEVTPDGDTILRFSPAGEAEQGTACELRIPSPETDREIRWEGTGRSSQKKSGAGLLLVPGFPAPCDVLPVGRQEDERVYHERIEAGGTVFSKTYRVSVDPVDVGEAKTMGWVRVETPGAAGLIMVTVTDEKGRPVVKQLWSPEGSWWLYEETPLRRSWLTN